MAQIQRVILFVSTGSYQCKQSLDMVSASGAPIEVVRLDTAQSRLAASRGKLFQVLNVPSLVTIFTDGKLQLFVGNDRVIPVLNSLTSPQQQQHTGTDQQMSSTPISDTELYDDEPQRRSRPRSQTKKKKPKHRKGGGKRKSGNGKRRQSPPQYEDENSVEVIEELEFEDEPDIAYRPPPPPTAGLLVGPSARRGDTGNKNIMEIAKRMAKQREATLGYAEKDLPKGGF